MSQCGVSCVELEVDVTLSLKTKQNKTKQNKKRQVSDMKLLSACDVDCVVSPSQVALTAVNGSKSRTPKLLRSRDPGSRPANESWVD
jgi:hypothetical protein